MIKHGYKDLAKYYDQIYQKKNYEKEVDFLTTLFERNGVKTILDAGCGTGTHMGLLENQRYSCDGIDQSQSMLDIARTKVKGKVVQADITDLNLEKKYDSIICMFAVFNHLLEFSQAREALLSFSNHLNRNGLLIIDLHNPQGDGKKKDSFGSFSREMSWEFDKRTKIEQTSIEFKIDGRTLQDEHKMRIYSAEEISEIARDLGYKKITSYENYTLKKAKLDSKNIQFVAKRS